MCSLTTGRIEILIMFVPEGPVGPEGPGGPTMICEAERAVRTGFSSGGEKYTNRHLNSNYGLAQKIIEPVKRMK